MTTLSPRQAAENRHFPFADHLFAPSRAMVCIAIPKNGCTDLKHWFVSLVDPERLADPSLRLHAHVRENYTLARVAPDKARRIAAGCFTFTFIRDPFARAVSAYVEKFVRPGPDGLFEAAREVVAHWGSEPTLGITFRQFVRFLAEAPDDHLDVHWRSQSSFLRGTRIDLLGRMDRLTDMLAAMGRELGMPPRSATRRNPTGYTGPTGRNVADVPSAPLHAGGVLPPASDLYDGPLADVVRARFRDDFLLYDASTDHVPEACLETLGRLGAGGVSNVGDIVERA